jgi:hypothetical protein
MSIVNYGSKPASPSACGRCKDSKKKCDKLLPSCSRCTRYARPLHLTDPILLGRRLWKECAYGSQMSYLTNPPFSRLCESQTSALYFFTARENRFSFPSSAVPSATIYENPAANPIQQLPTCILNLLAREDINIIECYETYFSIVAPRLPIISRKEFLYKISHTPLDQDAHLSLLVLCMALTVRSSLKPGESSVPGTIYYTAKAFFTVLSSSGKLCLELVQAGCLITHYEYCQALLEAALSSLWTCTRMGYILGLDKMLNPAFSFNLSDRVTVESGRCVWWSIFILERYQVFSEKCLTVLTVN